MVKNLPANAGNIRDVGLSPGYGRSPGEGNGYPFQCSYLGNPMDRGAPRAVKGDVGQTPPSFQCFADDLGLSSITPIISSLFTGFLSSVKFNRSVVSDSL